MKFTRLTADDGLERHFMILRLGLGRLLSHSCS